MREVLVHSCFSSEAVGAKSIQLGGRRSEKIFVTFPNPHCKCLKRISREARDDRLRQGELYVILRPNFRGIEVPEWREVVETGKNTRVPRGATVEKAHIERAYLFGGDDAERDRIEAYNEVNQAEIAKLGPIDARVRGLHTPPIPRELTMKLPEQPCSTYWTDLRT